MDAVTLILARFQFAMTTVFHFFFVPLSIGLVFVVAIMELLYVTKKNEIYKKMAKFWSNIFLLSFAVGVVTGLIQEFQFGMNWSEYSRFMGDIFGAPLAVEALLAFFMESTFLGLWMFTWDKVGPKLHNLFIWLVGIGTLMSSFWILVANSFMQHPVGYTINNGRAEMNDFATLITNPKVIYEFTHVITAAITLGGIAVAGMAAYSILKQKSKPLSDLSRDIYRKTIRLGFVVALVGSLGVLASGDFQMKAMAEDQPMKFAAAEGIYDDSEDPASWTVVAWMNEAKKERVFGIEIPYMLSILTYHKPSGSVPGMDSINEKLIEEYGDRDYYPPVTALFWSFRVMAGFGALMLLVAILGIFFTRKKKAILYEKKWMLRILGLLTFAPFLAITSGWLLTELGRYPWTAYGLFTIEQSVSPNVTKASLITSNLVYFCLFVALGTIMVIFTTRVLKKGPDAYEVNEHEAAIVDPFDGGESNE
jgi:Cytochrome bd-type quinol oxidase, subunit 1